MPIALGPALGGSSLIPCVAACAEAAGRPRDAAVLAGLLGHAFETSHALDGGELWSACALEWSHLAGLDRLGLRQRVFDLIGNNPRVRPRPSEEERESVLRSVFDAVADATARGRPALAWAPMSPEQREGGLGAFCWGLIEEADLDRREYAVVHRDAGRFRVLAERLGRIPPAEWLHVRVFEGPDDRPDAELAVAAARDAVRLLEGDLAGADMPSPPDRIRHGTAALLAWADEVERGGRASRARFWANARGTAAAFCRWAALDEAAAIFSAQAEVFRSLADGGPDAARIRQAADLQREAVEALRRAIA